VRLNAKTAFDGPDDECCRVCGGRGSLTFEHVPPMGAGNARNARLYGLENWLGRDEETGEPAGRATILQRGTGAHTLCRRCNELAGARYVPELIDWTERAGGGLVHGQPSLAELDAELRPAYVTTTFERVRPARFLKQVATMLLAIATPGFPPRHLDLCAFAQDPEWIGLPNELQFYLALYAGPLARFNGGTGRLREDGSGGWAQDYVIELAHPPFAYVLSVDETLPAAETGCISSFADLSIDEVVDVELTMQVGFGHTAFPLDYRTKAKLDADRAENEAAA
jgi:hypothetical protein